MLGDLRRRLRFAFADSTPSITTLSVKNCCAVILIDECMNANECERKRMKANENERK